MLTVLFRNTKSLASRLAYFFLFISIVMGATCYTIIVYSLQHAEHVTLERRIEIERDEALEYFAKHDTDSVQLNSLTTAYKNIDSVPDTFSKFIKGKDAFFEEVEEGDIESTYIYMDSYTQNGKTHHIIIVSYIENLEMTETEATIIIALTLSVVFFFFLIFAILLARISEKLITPFNTLKHQLDTTQAGTKQVFSVPHDAAAEFHVLAATLNEYTQKIEELIKREQSFARYTSHELRTPLTIMKGAASLLEERLTNAFEERQLKRIERAADEMTNIIDALLALVRYEKSDHSLYPDKLTGDDVEYLTEKYTTIARDKKISFVFDIQGQALISAPFVVIEIVLGNLLRNAITAMTEGNIYITLTDTSVIVRDEGVGLNTKIANDGGYGLGLMIIEDFCKRYGWKFSLMNRSQRGCIATINFLQDEQRASHE